MQDWQACHEIMEVVFGELFGVHLHSTYYEGAQEKVGKTYLHYYKGS